MPDITENDVREFISTNLSGDPEITAEAHQAVENKIVDYIVQENGKATKSKVLLLETFTTDRNYSVNTGLPVGAVIESVKVELICKVVNNGFSIGDVVTAPTPYPEDGGRTQAQGIGIQYNNASNGTVKVIVNNQLTIMSVYNGTPSAPSDFILFSGSGTANWSIKLIVGYK